MLTNALCWLLFCVQATPTASSACSPSPTKQCRTASPPHTAKCDGGCGAFGAAGAALVVALWSEQCILAGAVQQAVAAVCLVAHWACCATVAAALVAALRSAAVLC